MDVELLIMDDESTGTPKTEIIVQDLQNEGYAIRIHVRCASRFGRQGARCESPYSPSVILATFDFSLQAKR
jgi:hypothetical protein